MQINPGSPGTRLMDAVRTERFDVTFETRDELDDFVLYGGIYDEHKGVLSSPTLSALRTVRAARDPELELPLTIDYSRGMLSGIGFELDERGKILQIPEDAERLRLTAFVIGASLVASAQSGR